jgi:putative aminopeptidase FrvX
MSYAPSSDQVGGIVRSILAVAAGWAVGKGYIDNATAASMSAAGVTLIISVWSVYTHSQTNMIQSVNAAENGVKVVAATAQAEPVNAPLK